MSQVSLLLQNTLKLLGYIISFFYLIPFDFFFFFPSNLLDQDCILMNIFDSLIAVVFP